MRNEELQTCREHGVEEQHPSLCYVFGQFVVEQFGLACVFIALNQNLPDSDGTAAVAKALLHCFASSHDRNAANFALKLYAGIGMTNRSSDSMANDGKMV